MRDEKGNWERAKPAFVLSVDGIEQLLASWLANRRVVTAELLDGGLMNSNYRLHLSGAPEVCVLRICDRDPAACGREVAVLRLLHGSIPVPEVFYACLTPTPNAAAYAVLSFVEGMSLYDLHKEGDAESVNEASYDIGRVLPGLAHFEFSRVGPVSNAALINQLMEAPLFEARVGRELRERIQGFAQAHERRVAEVASKPTLVHGDFNSRNVLVQETKRGWRLSGILDWEFAIRIAVRRHRKLLAIRAPAPATV